MGLEDSIQADNGKKRIEDPIGGASSTVITCSICLEHVSIGGDRSTANLQCGHQFHLDCVGSAFNYISAMQCPNCRQLENGNWLFASGICSSVHEHMDDFVTPEEMYNMNYPDMFCPYRNRFGRYAFLGNPNLFQRNSDYSSLVQRYGQAEFLRQNAEISEYLSTPIYHHNFDPYVMQNIHRSPQMASFSPPHVPNTWNNIPMLSIARSNPGNFPAVDDPHHNHARDSLFNGNEALGSSANVRAPARIGGSDVSGITPMQIHSLVSRLRDLSVSTSSSPQYTEDSQHHAGRHENNGESFTSNIQTTSTAGRRHHHMEQSQQAFLPSQNSGFHNYRNTELNMASNNNGQYQWEGDLLAPFPLLPVEGDFPYWDRLSLVRSETSTTTPPPPDYGSNLFTSFLSQNYNGSNATTPSSNHPPTPQMHHLH